jgi:hypothetical protein
MLVMDDLKSCISRAEFCSHAASKRSIDWRSNTGFSAAGDNPAKMLKMGDMPDNADMRNYARRA